MFDLLMLAQDTTAGSPSELAPIAGVSLFIIFFGLCGLLNLAGIAFWIWALVDCCTKEFKGNDKVVWILVLVFTSWIGAIIYLLVGRDKAIRNDCEQEQ